MTWFKVNMYPIKVFIVVCFMLAAIMIGKNVDGIPIYSPFALQQALHVRDTKSKITLDARTPQYTVPDYDSLTPGSWYRVNFWVVLPQQTTPETSLLSRAQGKSKLIIAKQDGDVSTTIQQLELEPTSDYSFHSFVFQKVAGSATVAFLNASLENGPVSLQDIKITELSVTDRGAALQLPEATVAEVTYPVIENNWQDEVSTSYLLAHQRSLVGQLFVVGNADYYLSAVDFLVQKVGSAGNGIYRLEIRSASQVNGKVAVSDQVLAAHDFWLDDLLEPGDQNLWKKLHIPLAINLEPGKEYFLGISNSQVASNRLNTLRLAQTSGNQGYDKMAGTKVGSFVNKIYGANYPTIDGYKELHHAVTEPLDATKLKYTYATQGDFKDILDLNYDSVIQGRKAGGLVFYDTAHHAVVASTANGPLEYVVHTSLPIKDMNVDATLLTDGFQPARIWYSYDKLTWLPLVVRPANNLEASVHGIIDGKGQSTLYLRVSPNNEAASGNQSIAFGIHALILEATLVK
jgi:hypothetical protein